MAVIVQPAFCLYLSINLFPSLSPPGHVTGIIFAKVAKEV